MADEKIIKFGSDTKYRKQWFTGISFSHPAKMSLPLQLWIIDNFTKEGETILDPMAGMGTILVSCSVGRNVISLELEDKFVQMQRGNWVKIKQRGPQLGYQMGTASILQGDARNLEGVLVDKLIFSPPYALTVQKGHEGVQAWKVIEGLTNADNKTLREKSRKLAEQGKIVNQYGKSKDNIGNLPYGSIDAVISSPPYEQSATGEDRAPFWDKLAKDPASARFGRKSHPHTAQGYQVDAVISSPPYENQLKIGREHGGIVGREMKTGAGGNLGIPMLYSREAANIGNLKSDSYLSAMLLVYQNCFVVLKDGGLMILVTKNFIRNKQQVRLDLDTIKLCEQAGFTFQDRRYREMANQSFWRTIYYQKYPDVEPIKYEDVLIFKK